MMSLDTRYDALIEKHRSIEAKLADEMKRPLPDALVLQRLKRQKLLVKDDIHSWERLMAAVRVTPRHEAAGLRS